MWYLVCMYVSVCKGACGHACMEARRDACGLLDDSPSDSLEAESLTEPGDPRNPPSAAPLGTFPLTL